MSDVRGELVSETALESSTWMTTCSVWVGFPPNMTTHVSVIGHVLSKNGERKLIVCKLLLSRLRTVAPPFVAHVII